MLILKKPAYSKTLSAKPANLENEIPKTGVDEIFREMDQTVQNLKDKILRVVMKGKTVKTKKLCRDERMCTGSSYLKTFMSQIDAILDTFSEKFERYKLE